MWRKLLVFVILLIYCCCHSFSVPFFTDQPVSINTTLNSTVNFTCGAINATYGIVFFVLNDTGGNDIAASRSELVDKGFTERTLIVDGNYMYRTLSVEATETNNETTIYCNASPGDIRSDMALLLIQGPLASVGDLRATVLNGGSSVQLTWTEPYTLDSVPINGYSINGQSRLVNTTDTILNSTDNPVDPCTVNTANVSAINGAGEGEPANISFYYERVPQVVPANTTYLDISINDDEGQVTLHVTVNVSQLCPGEYPSIVTIYTNGAIQYNTSLVMTDGQLLTGNITLLIFDTQTFTINILLSNTGGEFPPIQFECTRSVCIPPDLLPSPNPATSSPTYPTVSSPTINPYSTVSSPTVNPVPFTTTTTTSPSPTSTGGSTRSDTLTIVGGAVGGTVGVAVAIGGTVLLIVIIIRCRKVNNRRRSHDEEHVSNPAYKT